MNEYLEFYLTSYQIIFVRYFIVALIAYIIFYVLLKNKRGFKKIQLQFPKSKDYFREIFYSVTTVIQFALMSLIIFKSPITQYSQIYFEFDDMPLWYYPLTFILMLILHDTYFYWMHRTLHHPRLFKATHLIHHKSTNPSPWAAYSFHPFESFLEASILPILAFAFPIHIAVFGLFFLFSIIYNVYGHLGYELYPQNFHKHWLGKWINTSVNHNLHHKYFENSYGLYFTFWDRIMGTMNTNYDTAFEEQANRKK